ncbi:MarR family winged helix-turn-helix transcriptional regulator [Sulfitobacter geojensis]|uniref:MarR family winged helix-turn-helix transcriptional regulator n=1 Tax=Sulfitobacter geojensis TaxID=1342299 RepID=UPI002493867F|nr:MarR family transcriptional regulator [Sulfitobacter geojensis]
MMADENLPDPKDETPGTALSFETAQAPDSATLDHGILHEFIGMYLRRAYEVAYEDFRARLGGDALYPGYFTILTLIVRNPRISQTQIGAASARDKSSVTKALRWMEDEGFITRLRSDADRRIYLSTATPAGIELQAQMEAKAVGHLQALYDAIGDDRYTAFVDTMKDLISSLETQAANREE